MRHVLSIFDLSTAEIESIFAISADLKGKLKRGIREPVLPGRVAALLFDKPSLRTRVSFETGLAHLGGSSLFLGQDVGWGKQRETIADFAQVLSQYVDVIICRTNAHQRIEELSQHSQTPVINGLTDWSHPCQALADLFTLQELSGPLAGKKLAFVGDANNVARDLAIICARLSVEFHIASPPGYQFDDAFLARLKKECPKLKFVSSHDPIAAVKGAAAVYTDVWASMGQESEQAARAKAFGPFQVNAALMQHAPKEACFLHCLPAHRGEEVTAEILDGPQSAVIAEAANRMHVQKGLLVWLLGGK